MEATQKIWPDKLIITIDDYDEVPEKRANRQDPEVGPEMNRKLWIIYIRQQKPSAVRTLILNNLKHGSKKQ